MRVAAELSLKEKLEILSDAAKYDVACTSSGVDRQGGRGALGNAAACGICHSFAADGRCISLLKILMTNECVYDCRYCVNRRSNDTPRASFTPEEICTLTMEFYRRNYIEGLFLSSGIAVSPDRTMGQIYETLRLLRYVHSFRGYIHVKGIPGASPELIEAVGYLADRMSVNLELPTAEGLRNLAPHKTRQSILTPIRQIQRGIGRERLLLTDGGHAAPCAPRFVPAGQSTQMIVGATPETDYQILSVAEALYRKFDLKRVFYSAYVGINEDSLLPAAGTKPPLLREHRLYQADWLLRFYGFAAGELLDEARPNFNVLLDPKCDWAVRHLEFFPVEVNRADYASLLRVPGIGVKSARRIVRARRSSALDFPDLKKMGVVLKRAHYFITCSGRMYRRVRLEEGFIAACLADQDRQKNWRAEHGGESWRQLSLFDDMHLDMAPTVEDCRSSLTGQL